MVVHAASQPEACNALKGLKQIAFVMREALPFGLERGNGKRAYSAPRQGVRRVQAVFGVDGAGHRHIHMRVAADARHHRVQLGAAGYHFGVFVGHVHQRRHPARRRCPRSAADTATVRPAAYISTAIDGARQHP
ncbi:hypothetical protein D3C87_1706640 [compost metagenome]